MDLTVTRFQEIYKNRALRFGAPAEPAAILQRQKDLKEQRRNSRHTAMMLKRKISVGTLTPIASPAVKDRKKKPVKVVLEEDKKDHRLEMLRKWQAEKRKLLQKQKNAKPLFKVHHVSTSSQFDLDKIYGEIKGKPIATGTTKKMSGSQQLPLVTSSTYKFKPPANIKPINLKVTAATTSNSTNLPKSRKKLDVMQTKRVTRSQKLAASPQLQQLPIHTRQRKNKSGNNNPAKPKSMASTISSALPEVCPTNNLNSGTALSPPVTPVNKCPESTVYVSPFVTMSRGKENARKEYYRRSIRGGTDDDKSTSPKAAANYFYNLLDNQIDRLRSLCHEWCTYKNEEKPSEEACDMIDVAIGQTELLITKKFQQFKGLVVSCETGDSEKPVTCIDLHGFWDMVMIQVDNLNKRFENLKKLKDNDWEEILPIMKPNQKKDKPKKKVSKKAGTVRSSHLRAVMEEARRKKHADVQLSTNEGMFLPAGSANTPAVKKRRTSTRSNLRISTLTSAAKRSIVSSPGLTMISVTQAAKSAEKSMPNTPRNHKRNSPKSILKSQSSKSVGRKSKVVLFRDNKSSTEDENEENNQNCPNMMDFRPISTPKRRSMRLAKSPHLNH